ncbi:MAG: 2-oxoacid:acceptor oxidoreductase subunit alpha [Synergistaceae bacterium]|nr:2-oxoacid:acceptor oxidoreductase subunit alpha [Synergistaceae bacterium]
MDMIHAPEPDVTITFCAAAGLGLQTAEDLARQMLTKAGYCVFTAREYMSRVRGGNNSTQIRVSLKPVRAYVGRIDWLFALSPDLRSNITEKITEKTKILGDASAMRDEISSLGREMIDLDLAKRAADLGSTKFSSMIVAGFIAGIFMLGEDTADELIEKRFADAVLSDKNKRAFRIGYQLGMEHVKGQPVLMLPDKGTGDEIFLDGNSAAALGAASAGCNYITAYPMSPGTGVFSYFAKNAKLFDCAAEQVEDEISAINMAVGAAYAGARAMVTTSGGGFALMCEGLSLAGITETPVVVHLAQRPGPATGLATRTEQADLELALYAGHGEFPRALYAPLNVESAFALAGRAFHTAHKYQVQSIILTDQYLLDSGYPVAKPDPSSVPAPIPPVRTKNGYKRYAFPAEGEYISPFGVPGFGEGFVSFDSHEHTEEAHITEDRWIRKSMVEKRLKKLEAMSREALPPRLHGPEKYDTAVICWGSVFEPLKEAMEILDCKYAALIACEQVYPLSEKFRRLISLPCRKIFVEGNATGQFSRVVRSLTGIGADETILKYNGFQFTVEELVEELGKLLAARELGRGGC